MNKEKNDGPIIKAPQAIERPSKRPPCYRAEIPNPTNARRVIVRKYKKPCSRCGGGNENLCPLPLLDRL